MTIGKNIQYLRKQKKITQEQLAEEMSVSRQTVSKWETDEIIPELNKLIILCDMFSCKLDTLVRENLADCDKIYSEITVKAVKGFREKPKENILSCFEYVYRQNGITCMDVHIHVDSVSKTEAFTNFS